MDFGRKTVCRRAYGWSLAHNRCRQNLLRTKAGSGMNSPWMSRTGQESVSEVSSILYFKSVPFPSFLRNLLHGVSKSCHNMNCYWINVDLNELDEIIISRIKRLLWRVKKGGAQYRRTARALHGCYCRFIFQFDGSLIEFELDQTTTNFPLCLFRLN